MSRLACAFTVLLSCCGCHYAKPNADCAWPQDVPMHGSLRQEAEFAEDLAIRYADARRTSWIANRNLRPSIPVRPGSSRHLYRGLYPRNEEFWDWAAMSAYASLAVSFLGMLAGEAWCLTMESLRNLAVLDRGHIRTCHAHSAPWNGSKPFRRMIS